MGDGSAGLATSSRTRHCSASIDVQKIYTFPLPTQAGLYEETSATMIVVVRSGEADKNQIQLWYFNIVIKLCLCSIS